jgi:hypothetical protein
VTRFDFFDLFGETFPRLAAALVVVALIFAPRFVGQELVAVGREEATQITVTLESAIGVDRHSRRHEQRSSAGDATH